MSSNSKFMLKAIELSIQSAKTKGGPFGCVIVKDNQIIAEGNNQVTATNDPTAHAEINVIRDACKRLKKSRLTDYDLYVTLEPCIMCAAAISQARIRRLYFGADDLKYGSINGGINYFQKNNTNHLPEIYDNICSDSCNRLLTNFFKERR